MLHLSWLKSWKANVIIQHVTLLLKQKRLESIEYCSSFASSVSKNGDHARHKSATHAWENTIKRVELRAVDRCVSLLSKLQTPSDSKRWRVTIPPAAQKKSCKPTQIGFYYALCRSYSKTTKNEDKERIICRTLIYLLTFSRVLFESPWTFTWGVFRWFEFGNGLLVFSKAAVWQAIKVGRKVSGN